jgi:hypothetical protein
MQFSRVTQVHQPTYYQAEGATYRYTAERCDGGWTLTIRRLETVAGIRVAALGRPFDESSFDTLAMCKAMAAEFEALGDDYRSADYGHRNRETEASLRAYGREPAMITNEATDQGETMAKSTTTTAEDATSAEETINKAVEQIKANIERAASLAEAENAEGLAELAKENEALVSSLPSRGKFGDESFAKLKARLRAEFRAAAQVQEKPAAKAVAVAAKAKEGAPVKAWDQFEGVKELVTLGAEKVAEGVRLHKKTSDLAKEIAAVTFDMWTRIPNKDEIPDLKGTSDQAKKAAGEMYRLAGEGFERTMENEDALRKLQRSVQTQRTDVRAKWLRELDEDTTDGADGRALYGTKLADKPDDMSVSEFVATKLYGSAAMLKGEGEKSLERWHAKQQALEAAGSNNDDQGEGEGEGEGSGEGGGTSEDTTPDERVTRLVKKLKADIGKAKPEDFEAASEKTRETVREELEKLYKAVKEMISATL